MTPADIAKLEQIATAVLSSEEDVRLKVVAEMFRLLGYRDDWLATEFPVYGFHGHKKLETTYADVVYFDDPSWSAHKTEAERQWVQDHALVLVEVKRPTESPDPSGQAEYYAQWLRAPYLASTNGSELIVRRYDGFCCFKEVLRVKRGELISRWAEIENILLLSRVGKFVNDLQLKAEKASKLDYEGYLVSLHRELSELIRWPISRSLQTDVPVSAFDLSLRSLQSERAERRVPAEEVLTLDKPVVILGEPGSGKTYLVSCLAKRVIESNLPNGVVQVPIVIKAKWWGKHFNTVMEAVSSELKTCVTGITPTIVESELAAHRFVILVDGYDEIREAKDTFQRDIDLLARSGGTRIILTSREANYHGELSFHFQAWKIEALSDEQIDQFAEQTISAFRFHDRLRDRNLLELARLPLYLVMLCQIAKKSDGLLPNNKAIIQEQFARFLLDEYPRHRNLTFRPAFSLEEKLNFLSELGKWRSRDVSFGDYARCAQAVGLTGDLALLLSEIAESGLLKGDLPLSLDFIHPTTAEFFHARSIASLAAGRIVEFIHEKHSQEEYLETTLFLVGLLRDQGKQGPVLDYLEENDLPLYLKCLSARHHTDLSSSTAYPDIERQYLVQLQRSYNTLLDRYFAPIKILFSPFRFMQRNQQAVAQDYKVRVTGSVDVRNSRLAYEYVPIAQSDNLEPSIRQCPPGSLFATIQAGNAPPTPVMAFSDGKRFYKDLGLARLGLDSAREVAADDVKDQLKKLISERHLVPPTPLACEQLVAAIHEAASRAQMWRDESLKSIWKFAMGIYETQEYLDAFESIQHHPFVVVSGTPPRALPLNLDFIIPVLRYFVAQSISISDNILPTFKISEESPDYQLNPVTIYDRFTPEQLKRRLEKLYTGLPKLYRELIDLNFPNLHKYFWHSKIYPFKYFIQFRHTPRSIYNNAMLVYCMPVPNEDETDADVKQVKDTRVDKGYFDSIHEEYVQRLKAFGRYRENYHFSVSTQGLDAVVGDRPHTSTVYKLIEDDMKDITNN